MKFDTEKIRGAIDSRLSYLDGNSTRRARIRKRIKGDQAAKRPRRTAWIALTAVTALAVAGIALTAGLNLFGFVGNNDARNGETAPLTQPAIIGNWAMSAAHEPAGKAPARITSVFYDSDSLIITYCIENGTWCEAFTPTQDQLAGMTKVADGTLAIVDDGSEDPTVRQYLDAMQNGTPAGLIINSLVADDHTAISGGADLGIADNVSGEIADGKARTIREYAVSLPERDKMNIEIALWKNVVYLYFDGANNYMMNAEPEAFGDMTATVWHTENTAETQRMTGTGMLSSGTVVQAEADVSATYGKVTITAYGPGFAEPNADDLYRIVYPDEPDAGGAELSGSCWYSVLVTDKNGNSLPVESTAYTDARTITATFEGTGSLPETLTVIPLLHSTSVSTNITPLITLKPAADPVYVASWEELNAAAEAGASNVIVTANITYSEADDTVVFRNAVSLQSAEGENYAIDGNGRQILCVQGENQLMSLKNETAIRNLTFQNGDASDKSMDVYKGGLGGAVFVQGPLLMENCTFQNNTAVSGALGVAGDVRLIDCVFTDNEGNYGGGLYIRNGDTFIKGCTFTGNQAFLGGGVYEKKGTVTIIRSEFLNNRAESDGGGMHFTSAVVSLQGCMLRGNTAAHHGGAVIADNGMVTLEDQTVLSNNHATYGGGMYANRANVVLDDADFINNNAVDGGGICLEDSSFIMIAGTVQANVARTGAGIYASISDVTLKGGTISENTAEETGGGIYLEESVILENAAEISGNAPDDVAQPNKER